ncbi:methylmalonyl-CoA epimerase [Silvanigrella aquatica]|uniref:Methylmalonyl-CoA epimerase n=1 Tax=Silvanigrella aquatica TaxID=1915309 RepID=A0A1L4D3D3_9BACT|nr:methylmalonyl-CoA epimerase [Silvanigrella aquatica]APJ04704.1 methylmalonyl-CoA epimerase [Silvanigrella aquatica]
MIIKRINHLGIVPKDLNQTKKFFTEVLGLKEEGNEVVAEQKVIVDFIRCDAARLELLSPTSEESPIAKFLETRGAGIQHVALEVDNLDNWIEYLKKNNIRLIDEKPRYGAHNTRIAFVHPHSTGGVLVELVEEQSK